MSGPGVGRIAWIDIAKASAILLIVVYHVATWFLWDVVPGTALSEDDGLWTTLSLALIPVRIPLFFLVSGLLAQRAIERPWRDLVRTRFVPLLWPFVVWGLLIALPWGYRLNPDEPLPGAGASVYAMMLGGTHFWYLPALVVVMLVARTLRRVPVLALAVTAVTSIAVTTNVSILVGLLGPYLGINASRWLDCAVWFMVGCFLPRVIEKVSRLNVVWACIGLVGFAALRTLLLVSEDLVYPFVLAALSIIGIASFVIGSSFLARSATARRIGSFFSARTLPIYVTHAFALEVLAVLFAWARREGWELPAGLWFPLLFVPVVVAIVVAVSVSLHALSRRWRFAWLYEPPAVVLTALGARSSVDRDPER